MRAKVACERARLFSGATKCGRDGERGAGVEPESIEVEQGEKLGAIKKGRLGGGCLVGKSVCGLINGGGGGKVKVGGGVNPGLGRRCRRDGFQRPCRRAGSVGVRRK